MTQLAPKVNNKLFTLLPTQYSICIVKYNPACISIKLILFQSAGYHST